MSSTGFSRCASDYVEKDGKYIVVVAPLDATVPYLPDAATQTTIGGTQYYVYNNVYFIAKSRDGDTVYEVVEPPGGG